MRVHKADVDRLFDLDFDLKTRTIIIADTNPGDYGFNPFLFSKFYKAFSTLMLASKDPIKIIINSRGGEWDTAVAMYDLIKSSECHITVEAMGACMSSATIILQAADERIAHKHTLFMVHDGQDGFEGDPKSLVMWAKAADVGRFDMYKIYAERTGRSVAFWEKRCRYDFIMTAKQAKEMNFIDKIIGEPNEE